MNEQAVLSHLVDVEKRAAALVEEARLEASALIAENERSCRAGFSEAYNNEYTKLEAEHDAALRYMDAGYEKALAGRRAELEKIQPAQEEFNALARKFLPGLA